MLSALRVGVFNRGETRADLKCEGKEPSESDKLTIDVIGVIRMSMQSFSKLIGIASESDDLHGAKRIVWSMVFKAAERSSNVRTFPAHVRTISASIHSSLSSR